MSAWVPSMRLTRREWTALAFTAPIAAQVTSKIPPQGAPAPPQPPATPQQRLQKAYDEVRSTRDKLSKIDLPMSIEPAFGFRAI
ncbi:MAG: hypothetical protein JO138_12420 [Acidobacteriaceae bacterium]|nr:hypothetical protein [Acidobacteriaceae bacterium]